MSATSWCGVLLETHARSCVADVKAAFEGEDLFTSATHVHFTALAKTRLTWVRFAPLDDDGNDFDMLLEEGRAVVRALARKRKVRAWIIAYHEYSGLEVVAFDAAGTQRWKGRSKSTPARLAADLGFSWAVDEDGVPERTSAWRKRIRYGTAPVAKPRRPSKKERDVLTRLAEWKTTLGPANAELFSDRSRVMRPWWVPAELAHRIEIAAMEGDELPERLIERQWAAIDPDTLDPKPVAETGALYLHVSEPVIEAMEAFAATRRVSRHAVLAALFEGTSPPAP
jgi:hypothetical protein